MKETTLLGWAIGVERLASPRGELTHRLVLVDGRASPNGQLVPGSGSGEIISVLFDEQGARALVESLAAVLGEREPVKIKTFRDMPPSPERKRAARRAARG